MSSEMVYDTIQKTIKSYIPNSRILLFGSRARGDYDKHSDYDLLVITPEVLTQKEKITWSTKLDWAIIKAIHIPVDLLVYSEEEVREKQQLPGHIIRTILKEGVVL